MSYVPRLKSEYKERVVKALTEEFSYKNVMQVPKLEKIVVSKGVGAAIADKKLIDYALEEVTKKGQEVLFVLHQPTEEILRKHGIIEEIEEIGIKIVPLIPYKEFVKKIASAPYVITDGGSIQEETAHLGVPCLLWRGKTERQNGLGQNVVISNYDKKTCEAFLNDFEDYRTEIRSEHSNPSSQVVDVLTQIMKKV